MMTESNDSVAASRCASRRAARATPGQLVPAVPPYGDTLAAPVAGWQVVRRFFGGFPCRGQEVGSEARLHWSQRPRLPLPEGPCLGRHACGMSWLCRSCWQRWSCLLLLVLGFRSRIGSCCLSDVVASCGLGKRRFGWLCQVALLASLLLGSWSTGFVGSTLGSMLEGGALVKLCAADCLLCRRLTDSLRHTKNKPLCLFLNYWLPLAHSELGLCGSVCPAGVAGSCGRGL